MLGVLREQDRAGRSLEVGELEAGGDGAADERERGGVIDGAGEVGAGGDGDLELRVGEGPAEALPGVARVVERVEGQAAAFVEVPRLVLLDAVEGREVVARRR